MREMAESTGALFSKAATSVGAAIVPRDRERRETTEMNETFMMIMTRS